MVPLALLLLGAPPPAAAADAGRLKIAVVSLKADEAQAPLAQTLVQLASSKLDADGVFEVITEDDVKQMVSFDQMKTALSCDEQASCLAEIGQALGVPYMLTGSLAQVGSQLVLGFVLIDIQNARPLERQSASFADVDAVVAGLPRLVERTVAELLYRQKGRLLVDASEEGAVVELDGKALGTTPFAEQEVPSGPHRVTVSKDGFIQFAVDVAVRPREQTFVKAPLRPSPEFLAAYRSRTGAVRAAAWGTGIGAGASAAVAAGGFVWAVVRFGALEADLGRAGDGNVHTTQLEPYVEVNAAWFTGIGGAAAAAGLAGASAWLFMTGEDPARYDAAAAAGGAE